MLSLSDIRGAIFDVDDTLLDNHPDGPHGLHERSRLEAVRTVGQRHGLPTLANFSEEANYHVFRKASVHSLEGALWQTFLEAGVVSDPQTDPSHPLIQEAVKLKNDLHEAILRQYGREVPGASQLITHLSKAGLGGHLAIASTAFRRDISLFLELSGLGSYFPTGRIFSREDVTHFKPHPEVFNRAFTSLGLPETARAHVLALEDDPRGLASAAEASLFTVALTTRFDRAALAALPTPPRLIVDSYAELQERILN